ncbi:MAG: LD-carboxypeptidase [Acholeplasmataceae bacterium]|nr:LD-carboxypeptidase [Acholeplasmataceae bacterium]
MNKPRHLKEGDKVAIVSLSSGILGDKDLKHQLDLGIRRLRSFGLEPVMMENTLIGTSYLEEHPEARASDLKQAFFDPDIKGIICAIGGDETYRLLPYLMEDKDFLDAVMNTPKLFTGFSDTTNNHLMFHKLGMTSYYGPNVLSDLSELGPDMLPYTEEAFKRFFSSDVPILITSSPVWYEERDDFSIYALGTKRIEHVEKRGYETVHGHGIISGTLYGGCLESLYDAYTGSRYPEQKTIYEHYGLMPSLEAWASTILFIETSEEQPSPKLFEMMLSELGDRGILKVIQGMIVGKPQNEVHYEAYKRVLEHISRQYDCPTLMNVNVGHAYPRTVLPYGVKTAVDFDKKTITIIEPMFV